MFSLSKRDCNYPSVCRYVHPLNKNTIYRHAWGAGRLGGGEGVRCGNVPVKNNANRFLFRKANYRMYIYLYPIPRVRSSSPLQPEKRVIIIYTSQNIKPLPRAVSSPMNPHDEGLTEYWRP